MNKREQAALQKYIGAESYALNDKLREGTPLTEKERNWTDRIDKALDKMPVYEGTVYRSLSSGMIPDVADFLAQHTAGSYVQYRAYTSAATDMYDQTMDIQLVIRSKTGHDLRGLNPNEHEILFKRDTLFEVIKKEGKKIWLTEL